MRKSLSTIFVVALVVVVAFAAFQLWPAFAASDNAGSNPLGLPAWMGGNWASMMAAGAANMMGGNFGSMMAGGGAGMMGGTGGMMGGTGGMMGAAGAGMMSGLSTEAINSMIAAMNNPEMIKLMNSPEMQKLMGQSAEQMVAQCQAALKSLPTTPDGGATPPAPSGASGN